MADEELRLEVSADVAKATADLNDFITTMGRMRGEGVALDDVIDKFDTSLTKVSRSLRDANTSATGTSKGFSQTTTSVNELHTANASIISQRYALYDVATTYGAISASLLGVSTLAVKTAADFESSFTSVERTFSSSTTTDQIANIRNELVDLSTQIPKSFDEISAVATLGNQLGIAQDDLEQFTKVVIQFATITGVSADQTALAFGQIANLANVDPSDFEALGSAIALVGVNSAATEAQIISVTKEIAKGATDAGFTTDQIIGLSGAIASLGIAPERARGSLDTYFNTLNRAVANGGEELQDFATIVGVTSDQLEKMVRQGQGEEIFSGFLAGLRDLDNVDTTRALDKLNLSQLRVANSLGRLANAQTLYNSTQADAARGWAEQAELQRQFDLIADDLNSQFKILVNSVNALIDSLTGGLVPGLAGAVGMLAGFVNWLREITDNPAGQWIATFALSVVTLVGVLTAFRAASALATASSYALVVAQASLAATSGGSAAKGILGLIGILTGYTRVAADGTVATVGLRGAIQALGRATIVLALLAALSELVFNFNESMRNILGVLAQFAYWLEGVRVGLRDFVGDVVLAIAAGRQFFNSLFESISKAFPILSGFFNLLNQGLQLIAGIAQNPWNSLGDALRGFDFNQGANTLQQWGKSFPVNDINNLTNAAMNGAGAINSLGGSASGSSGNLSDLGKSAAGAAAEVRTLVDYASDLGGVFDRTFEIQFGSQAALDAVTTQWIDLNEQMRDYLQTISELTADKRVKEYFLGIAEAYGDTLRAGVLRSELGEIDNKLADAQAGASKELVGNSKAAINNRKTITGLVSGYQDYIQSLAASGANQTVLNAAVAQSRNDFIAQAVALGYADDQLQPYIASFGNMTKAINAVPRNITVSASTDPAQQAINEFMAANTGGRGASAGISVPVGVDNSGLIAGLQAQFNALSAAIENPLSLEAAARNKDRTSQMTAIQRQIRQLQGYRSGGYTGNGGTSDPAGIVHGKEFVFTAQATKNAGVGNLYGMMRSFEQGRGYQQGGYAGPVPRVATAPGVQVVAFEASQFAALLKAGNVTVNIGAEQITNVVGKTNQTYANLGRG